jgi:hypothetical protein
MSEGLHHIASGTGFLSRLARALPLALLAAGLFLRPDAAGLAGEGLGGELVIRGGDTTRIEQVEFNYDGRQFSVASPKRVHDLSGKGGVNALLDDLTGRRDGNAKRRIQRVTTDATGDFAPSPGNSGPSIHLRLEGWAEAAARNGAPAAPEMPEIGGTLMGDDIALSHVAVEADGHAYYFATDAEAGGTFGEIDLATNTTTRLLAGLPEAADVADDPHTGDLIVLGESEVAQIQPVPEAQIVSRHAVPPGAALESVAVDGDGRLFARRADGEIVFIDYRDSRRIGAKRNFNAAARPVPRAAKPPAAASKTSALHWLDLLIVLAAGFSLAAAMFATRCQRGGRRARYAALGLSFAALGWSGYLIQARFTGGNAVAEWQAILALAAGALLCAAFWRMSRTRAGAADSALDFAPEGGEELVYSRWPEDWSQLKRLVDSMSEAERASLGSQIECHPDWLDDARALIRRPVAGGMSELRGKASFGTALADFARQKMLSEWHGGESEELRVHVRHRILPGAREDWSRVVVEASVNEALAGALSVAEEQQAAGEERAAGRSTLASDAKPRRSFGDIASDTGFFNVRWLFENVARRLVADGAASRLDLDADNRLRMAGDADSTGEVLEDVLRAALDSQQREGEAPPALAVMAFEEQGQVHFIALGGNATGASTAALPDDLLARADAAARKTGGRVWVEPGESGQVCNFTLAGEAQEAAPRASKRRAGWRPENSKAVWSMGGQRRAARF